MLQKKGIDMTSRPDDTRIRIPAGPPPRRPRAARSRPARGLLFATALLASPTLAAAAPIAWTSTSYLVGGNSRVGRCAFTFAPLPCSITGIEASDVNSSSGTSLPVPGPGNADTFDTSVSLGFAGSGNERGASTAGSHSGSLGGTVTMANGSGAKVTDNSLVRTIAANATGTTTFTGDFVSTGGSIDLMFSGEYSLLAFVQQSMGGSVSRQRSVTSVGATLLVEDLTAPGTLFSGALLSDSLSRGGFGVSRVDFVPFAGTRSVDLSGTVGNTLRMTLTTTTSASAFAGLLQASHPVTGATTSSELWSFGFSVAAIPEPATGLLLATAIGWLAILWCRQT